MYFNFLSFDLFYNLYLLKLAKFAKASCLGCTVPGVREVIAILGIPIPIVPVKPIPVASTPMFMFIPIIPWFIIGVGPMEVIPIVPDITLGIPIPTGMGPPINGLVWGRTGVMLGGELRFTAAKFWVMTFMGCCVSAKKRTNAKIITQNLMLKVLMYFKSLMWSLLWRKIMMAKNVKCGYLFHLFAYFLCEDSGNFCESFK